ncbi:hypothetical protein Col01nite_04200 [Cellulomonas oligotrophica]|uniref:TPM domain-containing protein n=1 Tax=Cellulomonas oligotrophica TaxID=931536 RepID=A0ABQ4D6C0_9CELL|nr:hypothetical protein Col01nite_04200 [Cellulomonas oligotrophica]
MAAPPLDLVDEVTDEAGVLDGRTDEVRAAVDALADRTPYQLFVVYVDTFDDLDPAAWADATAQASDLGRDDVLLAVAVESRRYQVSVDDAIGLTDAQLDRVQTDRIEPALREDDWAGAAVAAAEGYQAEVAGEGRAGRVLLGLLAAVVLLAGAAWAVVAWRRRRAAAEDLDELEARAGQALVAADDAVQASATELGFADAQLGPDAVGPFVAALDEARALLTRAFEARHALDDGADLPDAEQHARLTQVLALCDQVDDVLDAQTDALARLRDLHARAPQVLDELAARADALDARTATARTVLQRIAAAHAASVVAPVADHAGTAAAQVAHARDAVAQGRAVLDADRPAAVLRAGDAEGALAGAAALLDAVDHLAADLAAAPARIDAAVTSISSDVDDAARLAPTDPQVGAAVADARAAVAHAQASRTAGDPPAALHRLADAEARLDALLAPARAQAEALARARERLPVLLAQADASARSAADLLATQRSAVGAGARTRFAEGQRLLVEAHAAAPVDPVTAAAVADRAVALLAEAHRAARADLDAARRAAAPTTFGGGWSTGSTWGGSGGGRSSGGSTRRSSGSSRRSTSTSRRSSSPARRSSSSRSTGRRGGGGRF